MAAKSTIKPTASSSEEEFSFEKQKGKSKSEYEETDDEYSEEEIEETKSRPKSVSQDPIEKIQEENDGSSEESDSEEEETGQEEHDPKPVSKGNKEPQTKMVPPAANSIKIKSGGRDSKKSPIPRVWSLEDEKTLMNSMLQFPLETGKEVDPSSLEYFCDFLKGKLSFTGRPGRRQVSDKIKALKKKYSRKRFTKKHDLEMKEIATQLWKLDVNCKSPKRKLSLLEEEIGKLGNLRLKKKLKSGYNAKKAEVLEQKIKKQKILEMQLELKRIDLKRITFKLILDVVERRGG